MSMALKIAAAFGGAAAAQIYVDDVFSTYLYTGNGSTQTINNGIDLAGQGGLVWIKHRNAANEARIVDTLRGASNVLYPSLTSGQQSEPTGVTSFNSSGYSLDSYSPVNSNSGLYTSWTFRKAPRFFDVVTWTGNGVAGRTIPHSLGVAPGMIVVKCTSAAGDYWTVYHRSLGATKAIWLNVTDPEGTQPYWDNTAPTSSVFSVGSDTSVNGSAKTYVAYLFAHDTATDGIIQAGSFTTNGSGNATVNLGWEPQFVIVKSTSTTDDWRMIDSMRGWATGNYKLLKSNSSEVEGQYSDAVVGLTPTGFVYGGVNASHIYLAIRRPNKPPTSGTQVFMPVVYTGTNVDNRLVDTTIAPDFVMVRQRDSTTNSGMVTGTRLTGNAYMQTGSTAAESTDADSLMTPTVGYGNSFSAMNGFGVGNDATSKLNASTTASNQIVEAFKRAPGVFDVVCWTVDASSPRTIPHNLGVAPELIIDKSRNAINNGIVYAAPMTYTDYLVLDSTAAASTNTAVWYQAPTATNFYGGSGWTSGENHIALLFATKPGISKVGSYTGNGTSQTIDCGFTTGARFVLIKRTDSTGDWYLWDTARGITAGTHPFLKLNDTAAEDSGGPNIQPDSSGFYLGGDTGAAVNINSATYIYLAFA